MIDSHFFIFIFRRRQLGALSAHFLTSKLMCRKGLFSCILMDADLWNLFIYKPIKYILLKGIHQYVTICKSI